MTWLVWFSRMNQFQPACPCQWRPRHPFDARSRARLDWIYQQIVCEELHYFVVCATHLPEFDPFVERVSWPLPIWIWCPRKKRWILIRDLRNVFQGSHFCFLSTFAHLLENDITFLKQHTHIRKQRHAASGGQKLLLAKVQKSLKFLSSDLRLCYCATCILWNFGTCHQDELTAPVKLVYGLMLAPGTLYCLAKPSTSWIRAMMAWNSFSASPKVALNWAWASIRPWISSKVCTMNMSTKSSRVPSNQLLKGCKDKGNIIQAFSQSVKSSSDKSVDSTTNWKGQKDNSSHSEPSLSVDFTLWTFVFVEQKNCRWTVTF